MISKISLATDFSPEGERAFHAALALAVFNRAAFEILHVSSPGQDPDWEAYPRVRLTLEGWGLLPPQSHPEDVHDRLGVAIAKIDIHSEDAAAGIAGFMLRHRPGLLVAASHGRTGINRWLAGSVAIETLRMTDVPALLFGPSAASFVDEASGRLALRSILFPVAASPPPAVAAQTFAAMMGHIPARLHHVHVHEHGAASARLDALFPGLTHLQGEVVPEILQAARDVQAGMIVMPTAGHHGFIDALRGSVTQRVLHDAPCAILALPS